MRTLTVSVVLGLVLAMAAQPALAKSDKANGGQAKVEALTVQTGTVLAGDSAWIEVVWESTGGDAEDFSVTVKNPDPGWEVRYPDSNGSFTSGWADSTLSDGEIDFTAIHVTVPYEAKTLNLHLEASYTTDGKSRTKNFSVKVPVAGYSGDDLAADAGSAVVDGSGWIDIAFTGMAPRLDDFQLTAAAPPELLVTYPGDGTSTSLAHDARLEDGESDMAAFRVDASGAPAGTYAIALHATYTKGSTQGSWDGSVTITVP